MSFSNPLLLLGLFGASVPVIIHLIHKRRPRRQRFAALELLLKSIDRVERRWRLKRFLLLASRVLLLGALSLAAAGPLFRSEKGLAISARGPKRLAIVVDTTLSMRAKYGDQTSFARAITSARSLVDAMGPEDQAIVVSAGAKPELLVPRPTASRSDLLRAIDRLKPGYSSGEMGEAVTVAAQALASLRDAPPGAGEPQDNLESVAAKVIVLSDLAGHGFRVPADVSLGASGKHAELEIVDVLSGVPAEMRVNHAVTSIEMSSLPGRAPRTIEVRARVQSFAKEGKDGPAATDITLVGPSGNLVEASVDVVPGTITDRTLEYAFETPGYVPIELRIEPDALAEDDTRYGIADVRHQVRTLIVDGAPSGVPKEDEIFYLERALLAGAGDQPHPRVITPDDLAKVDLSLFDVVMLAGVGTLGRSEGSKLTEFVERGGGLFISTCADLDIDAYNTELGRVLPRALRALKVVDPETGGLGADGLVTLRSPLLEHSVLEIFGGEALGGLLSARTRAYVLLEPAQASALEGTSGQVLVEYDDGQPALIEGGLGEGRVILLTTSIDRDLTDLPIRPAFVPLIRRIILELGDALSKPDPRRTLVGEIRRIRIPQGATRLSVTSPEGQESVFLGAEIGGGELEYSGTQVPGHYAVKAAFIGPLDPLEGEGFAANVDTGESDTRPITVEEAAALLLGTGSAAPRASGTVLERAQALAGLANPEAVAGALLLLMLLSFLLESALTAQRIGR